MDSPITFKQPFKRVIQLELNEISKNAIDHLVSRGKCSNFSRVNRKWNYFETTSESNYDHLEPWIQWITAHTGKSFSEHQIFHLSDATHLKHPQIWETLSERGIESCVVGSMNAVRGKANGGFFFPDPWSKNGVTYPAQIQPLWDLISKKVQSHATTSITTKDLLKGFEICRQFRLPMNLYRKIGIQLISQKWNSLNKWKMPGIFDLFLVEIFKRLLRLPTYGYYALFLNAVAHYQHHYWRHFQTNLFHGNIKSPDCHPNDDPMTYGYELYDRIVKFAIELAQDPNTLVIIASGLSQEPFLHQENEGGMNYYRLYNHNELLKNVGLDHYRVLPLMSRDWQIETVNGANLNQAQTALSKLTVENKPLFHVSQNTPNSLFIETAITHSVPKNVVIKNDNVSVGAFHRYFHHIAVKSGHHVGTGCLWLSQPPLNAENIGNQIPLTQLYPLTLKALTSTTNLEGIAIRP